MAIRTTSWQCGSVNNEVFRAVRNMRRDKTIKSTIVVAFIFVILTACHTASFFMHPGFRHSLTTTAIVRQKDIRVQSIVRPRKQQDYWSILMVTASQGYEVGGSTKNQNNTKPVGRLEASIRKLGMKTYIALMCIFLPISLFPVAVLKRSRLVSKTRGEHLALQAAEFCAKWLLRLIPFTKVNIQSDCKNEKAPNPTIWVANHVSQLDTFLLLASDEKLRGKYRRPLKTIYWKGLDNNPICKMVFHLAGFIQVDMANNGSGMPNEYDKKSFKSMLKQAKQAFEDGFDMILFPEGQLNPDPEQGLQPIYSGAFSLAKMSKRPIRFVAIHGSHKLWSEKKGVGMKVTGREVLVRVYPQGKLFHHAHDFEESFRGIVGHFGMTGKDLPDNEQKELLYGESTI